MHVTSQRQLAKLLRVHPNSIKNFVLEGAPAKGPEGYDIAEWFAWYFETRGKTSRTIDEEGRDWELESKRQLALMRETQRRRLEGELVDRDRVEHIFAERCAIFRMGLRDLEHFAAPKLSPAMPPTEVGLVLRGLHDDLLEGLSAPLPGDLVSEDPGDPGEPVDEVEETPAPRKRGRPKGAKDKRPRKRKAAAQ